MRFLIEWSPAALAALLALAVGAGRFRFFGGSFARTFLSRPKSTAGAVTLALCMLLALVERPAPYVHDEFAYLLAADTFTHGRLTNPTPPAWEHFESFHTIVTPSYQAKYPPGQGLFLAAGQLLAGHPIVGVWLSMTFAAMALAWMLEAWFPPGWALLGGLLPILRFGALGNWNGREWAMWTNSYWGGGVALLGGALLLGAACRLSERAWIRDGLWLGLGIAILANSRPYEGLVASAVIGVALLRRSLRRQPFQRVATALGACALVLLAAGAWMAAYNRAVTGDPLRMPYSEYYQQYELTPQLSFMSAKAQVPEFRHEVFHRYALEFQVSNYIEAKTTGAIKRKDVDLLLSFFLGPALLVPLAIGVFRVRSYWQVVAAAVLALSVAAHLFVATSHYFPHYLAPAVPALLALIVWGWRGLAEWSPRGRPVGAAIAAGLVIACVGSFALSSLWRLDMGPEQAASYAFRRVALKERLSNTPGKHLVVVQYQPGHDIHQEWVYNGADFEVAKVLWARSMTPDKDRALIEAFPDRKVWLLNPDLNLWREYRPGKQR